MVYGVHNIGNPGLDNIRSVGIGHAGSYQAAGVPFLTGSTIDDGSEVKISFPSITKNIIVINRTDVELRVHFASKSNANVYDNRHYITLVDNNDTITLNMKCREVYVSNNSGLDDGNFELFAELTSIKQAYNLTGEGIDS